MAIVSMKALLEAGVHFGHQPRRWNPKMKPFIFTERNGIHIIDLQQTVGRLNAAYNFVREVAARDEAILFVGTKKQAQDSIAAEAKRCNQFYVNQRWLGGMLTNFKTIQQRIRHLEDLEARRDRGDFERMTKKEALKLEDEIQHLTRTFGGIRTMKRLPAVMFIIDPKKETNAVNEARRLEIPIVGLADTNCDPDLLDYPIPANDDAIRAVRLLTGKMADAVEAGRREWEAAHKDESEDEGDELPEGDERAMEPEVRLEEFARGAPDAAGAEAANATLEAVGAPVSANGASPAETEPSAR